MGLHAQGVRDDVVAAAREAGVSEVDLAGAVNSLETAGVPDTDPFSYLRSTGELPPIARPPAASTASPPVLPAVSVWSARVECIIRVESHGDPLAHNRSGASGLGQFLPSTWVTTPQGLAGYSVYNAEANRSAIQWMIDSGRAREFDAVRFYGC